MTILSDSEIRAVCERPSKLPATARALSDQIHSDIESLDVPDYVKEAFPNGIR